MMRRALLGLCLLLALPVAGVLGSWLGFDAVALRSLSAQWSTVLPGYAVNSLVLALSVALGTAGLGAATAAAVSLFEFRGRRLFEWALLLPLAMPAYVLAYAYTDFLQTSGGLQSALRAGLGLQGALWPDVRSLWGAVILFVLCLYPYVYLLTRAALAERGVPLMEAARMLGAGTGRRVREVALPLARPAIVAGVALALMETLADYGVGSYFGLATFTTGIYKAWLVNADQAAAAQLASMLLVLVGAALWLEKRAQRRMRFVGTRRGAMHAADARALALTGPRALLAQTICALPVLLGFVLPVAVLLGLAWQEWRHAAQTDLALPLARFASWAWTSLKLAGLASALAALLALALAFSMRAPNVMRSGAARHAWPSAPGSAWGLQVAARTVSMGYAVPGAVIAIGILVTMGWAQSRWPQIGVASLVTGTVFGLMYAYMVRFAAVALQSVEAGYARVPASLDETARMLGTSRSRVFFGLHLPLLRRSVMVAMLLVFVDVMKELPATLVLRPFDTDTLAVVAYQLARDERLGEAALPSLAIVLVGLLPVLLLARGVGKAETH